MADIINDAIRAEAKRKKDKEAADAATMSAPGPTQAKSDLQSAIRTEKIKREILAREADAADAGQDSLVPAGPNFEHGVLFGLDVPLSGLANALNFSGGGEFKDSTFSERYQAGEEARRTQLNNPDATLPVAQEIAGNVVSGGAAGAGERWAADEIAGQAAPRIAPSLFQTAAESTALGAGTGFVHGVASGEGDWRDRLLEGGKEAAIGGTFGALAPAVGGELGKAIDLFRANPDVRARQALYVLGQREGLTTQTIDDLIARNGPETMALDVSEAARGAGRTAANLSPEARETLTTATEGRYQGQNPRLAADVQAVSGLPPNDRRTVQDIIDQNNAARMPAIDAAYDAARLAGQELPDEPFRQILETPMGRAAYEAAGPSLLNRRGFRDVGTGVAGALARLDQTKIELDTIAATARRAGDNNRAAQAEGLSALLRQRIDETLQDPVYAEARQLRRDAYRVQEATQTGADVAGRGNLGGPAAAAEFTGDASQLAGLRAGYGQETANALLSSQPGGALNPLTTPLAGETRQAIFGGVDPLEESIARERLFNRGRTAVGGNSSTVRQLFESGGLRSLAGAMPGGLSAIAAMLTGHGALTIPALAATAAGAVGNAAWPAIQRRFVLPARQAAETVMGNLLTQSPRGIPLQPVMDPAWQRALTGAGSAGGRAGNVYLSPDAPVPVEPTPTPNPNDQSMLENDYPVPVDLVDPADVLRRRGLRYG